MYIPQHSINLQSDLCHGCSLWKRAAGVSYRPAVQANMFFVEQSCVDEHVAGTKTRKLIMV